MPNFRRTTWFVDRDMIRDAVKTELGVRGVSYQVVQEETGVLAAGVGRFVGERGSLDGDALVSLAKWSGLDVNRVVRRRKAAVRHTDTYEQRKLRTGSAYLKSLGVQAEDGESSVDALMRLVEAAKQNGFLGSE